MMLSNKNILIVGGTGSFGSAFLRHLLTNHKETGRLVIYSRDEQKQYELANTLHGLDKKKVSFFVGDVRDKNRLHEVMHGINIVIYAAAMKHMPIAEANPTECIKTNILGTQNLVEVALDHKVERVVALSTDKAVMPINTYGASKLLLEKLVISANSSPANAGTKLCAVRYANVLGSRGSVVPFFLKMRAAGVLPITDMKMTRFSITMAEGISIVMHALTNTDGGEVFVPKAPSYKITTVAEAIGPECELKEVGIRNGEKIDEAMVSKAEAPRTIESDNCYVVLSENTSVEEYLKHHSGKRVDREFEYNSATNTNWLTVDQLRKQIESLA